MSSIVTNTAAMTALQSLNATMKNMETTQSRISTGLRVNTAADNAAYWSIATTMRSDKSAMSTVSDALNLGSSTLDVAYTGMNAAIDVANQIKTKLVAAAQPGVDRTKIQSEITQLQSQLKANADSAVFSGQNWLSVDSGATGYNATKSIVSSFQHDAAGNVTVGTIGVNTASMKLFDATSTSVSQTVYDVSFTAAGNVLADLNSKFTGAATGNTATVTFKLGAQEQDATVTKTATGWNVAFSSLTSYTAGAITTNGGISVKGSALAGDTTTALTVATHTNLVKGGGILDSTSALTSASVFNLNISALTDSATDLNTLTNMIKQVDSAIGSMTSAGAAIGASKSRVTMQQSFVSSLMDSIDKGVGSLVDADMNHESTKLQALQVQQQLGVQALSIANQSAQSILSLFRG